MSFRLSLKHSILSFSEERYEIVTYLPFLHSRPLSHSSFYIPFPLSLWFPFVSMPFLFFSAISSLTQTRFLLVFVSLLNFVSLSDSFSEDSIIKVTFTREPSLEAWRQLLNGQTAVKVATTNRPLCRRQHLITCPRFSDIMKTWKAPFVARTTTSPK